MQAIGSVVVLGLAGVLAAAPPSAARLGLVEAEWAFIHHCEQEGIRAAFLRVFDPEGLVFQPLPVNGREWYTGQPKSDGLLAWYPAVSAVAASDDVGYNAGPFEWRPRPGAEPIVRGWFLSVWKRDPRGEWKLLWDLGIPVRDPGPAAAALRASPPATKPASGAAPTVEEALELDRRFAARIRTEGWEGAYRTQLAPQGRIFRSPSAPVSGWSAAAGLLKASVDAARSWEPARAVVARSGELAFVQGTLTISRGEGTPPERGSYVRVWRRQGDAWRLELDLELRKGQPPAPPPNP